MRTNTMVRKARQQLNTKGRIKEKLGRRLVARLELLDGQRLAQGFASEVAEHDEDHGAPWTPGEPIGEPIDICEFADPTPEVAISHQEEPISWVTSIEDGRNVHRMTWAGWRVELQWRDASDPGLSSWVAEFHNKDGHLVRTIKMPDEHMGRIAAENYARSNIAPPGVGA